MIKASAKGDHAERWAWAAWAGLAFAIACILVFGDNSTVVSVYRDAARRWFSGRDIYNGRGIGFLYLPQAAILFAPFAYLPLDAGEIGWRIFTIGSFAAGLYRLSALTVDDPETRPFALLTLVTLPMCFTCAQNGQATLPMSGMMMLGVAEMSQSRWWRATLWLSLGMALKPLIIVLVLLAWGLERPLRFRLPGGLVAVALLPFLTQHPTYVIDQYGKCLTELRVAAHLGVLYWWAQPFSVLALLNLHIPEALQTATRVFAAVATFGLAWTVRKRFCRRQAAVYLFALATIYILLFNPRTENNTYNILGPVLAVFIARSLSPRKQPLNLAVLCALIVMLAMSYEFCRLFTPPDKSVWLKPVAGIGFLAYLVADILRTPTVSPQSEATGEILRQQLQCVAGPAPLISRGQLTESEMRDSQQPDGTGFKQEEWVRHTVKQIPARVLMDAENGTVFVQPVGVRPIRAQTAPDLWKVDDCERIPPAYVKEYFRQAFQK